LFVGDWADYSAASGAVTVSLATNAASGAAGNDSLAGIENVRGGNGDDSILGTGLANFIEGGLGNDTLNGGGGNGAIDMAVYASATGGVTVDLVAGTSSGAHGIDSLTGFEGIQGGSGDDLLIGGTSTRLAPWFNQIYLGGRGNDTIIGGDPTGLLRDEVFYEFATGAVTVDLVAGTASGAEGNDSLSSIEVVRASSFDDFLVVGAGQFAFGGLGNDTIVGLSNTATLMHTGGGLGSATVDLNAGFAISSGGGTDSLFGIQRVEISVPATGFASILGNENANFLASYSSADTQDGAGGDDTLWAGGGNDSLIGGGGHDWASYERYTNVHDAVVAVTVDLGAGTATGSAFGNDTLTGIEAVLGSEQNDSLLGSARDETLAGANGNDVLDGGAGNDWASYADASAAVTVNLAAGISSGAHGVDNLTGFEAVLGGNFNDSLLGGSSANTLVGAGGSDTLDGGAGDDSLQGGAGNDLVSYGSATAGVIANLSLGFATASADTITGFESLLGSSHNDTLVGDSLANGVSGGDGNDTLSGLAGNDTLDGGVGDDTVASEAGNDSLFGGVGNDLLDYSGTGGAVTVDLGAGSIGSGAGNDLVSEFEGVLGGSGADRLLGGDASETLSGGAGNDTIAGGLGDDSLLGGTGVDWADYGSATGAVTVSLDAGGSLGAADGAAGGDLLSGIENLLGGNGNDSLLGDAGANTLLGGNGVDQLSGGNGNDWLDFGAGDEFYQYLTVDLFGNETLLGGAGNDTLNLGETGWSVFVENPKDPTPSPWTTYQRADGTFIYTQGWEEVICFAEGTRIMTPDGEAKVEDLRAGDMVLAMRNGQAGFEALAWVGSMDVAMPRDAAMAAKTAPILIKAGALSDGMPARDLRVSPDHAIEVDGYLIPAKHLVNGESIIQEAWCQRVRYFHLELEAHGLLLADGAWSESYLEDGNRQHFNNASLTGLFLDFEAGRSAGQYDARACLPVLRHGLKLELIQGRIAIRAEELVQAVKGRRRG
jgi:Ca2+-binding RTX toxin-like protein